MIVLEKAGNYEIQNTALLITGELTLEAWESLGMRIGRWHRSTLWLAGDWCNFGENRFGEAYSQAIEATGLAYQTLANAKWVSACFVPERRRETLSWSHHAEVARLEPADQDHWLTRAEEEGWTVPQLREAMRQPEQPAAAAVEPAVVNLVESMQRIWRDMTVAQREEFMAWLASGAS